MSTGVWADLVGQERVVATFQRAVAGATGGGHSMTHAWLITGPPGSGRSNAARAFAAALQCHFGGCGECNSCTTSLSGAHPDVTLVRTEQLSISVDQVRELVRRAVMAPTLGGYQVLVVEDADRITERGEDALLKSIEEPGPRTVWLLCAPTPDDVVATLRSRCRLIELATPTTEAVAQLLRTRDGVDPGLAEFAARVCGGHIGRARALAGDPMARQRREEVLGLPTSLLSVGNCLAAAEQVVQAAEAQALARTAELDARERAELGEALGTGTRGIRPRNTQAALKELEDQQKARAKRLQRDALDWVLTDLTSFYRDVLTVQVDAGAPLLNTDFVDQVTQLAAAGSGEETLARLDAILACRRALAANVTPLLAVESLMLSLAQAA